MEILSKQINDYVPEFNQEKGIQFLVVSTIFWAVVYWVMHYLMITPFMHLCEKSWPSTAHWHQMDFKKKLWYTSYLFGIAHAILSTFGSAYCLFYADGKPGTNWFNSLEYSNQMFDI
jgi:hypothetical protein